MYRNTKIKIKEDKQSFRHSGARSATDYTLLLLHLGKERYFPVALPIPQSVLPFLCSGYKLDGDNSQGGGQEQSASLSGQRGSKSPHPSFPQSKSAQTLIVIVDPDRPKNRVRFGKMKTEVSCWSVALGTCLYMLVVDFVCTDSISVGCPEQSGRDN